jgi:uncharacterized Zn-binding protein involved in type VI secretion
MFYIPTTTGFTLPATRIGDADFIHCSVPHRAMGSPNVLVNSIPWSREGDYNDPHLLPCDCPPCCCFHAAKISTGSKTVFVNGQGAGRMFDRIKKCTAVAQGSPNVLCGG